MFDNELNFQDFHFSLYSPWDKSVFVANEGHNSQLSYFDVFFHAKFKSKTWLAVK